MVFACGVASNRVQLQGEDVTLGQGACSDGADMYDEVAIGSLCVANLDGQCTLCARRGAAVSYLATTLCIKWGGCSNHLDPLSSRRAGHALAIDNQRKDRGLGACILVPDKRIL